MCALSDPWHCDWRLNETSETDYNTEHEGRNQRDNDLARGTSRRRYHLYNLSKLPVLILKKVVKIRLHNLVVGITINVIPY